MALSISALPALAEDYDPNATIYLTSISDPVSCDPALASDGASGMVVDRVFSALVRFNPDGSVYPEIAESFEISDDGLVYTFKIREGITFHDGTVCDASAVKWNFDRQIGDAATPDMPYAKSFFGPIVSCEAPDDYTVVITLDAPNSAFIVYNAMRIGMGIASPTAWEADPEGFARNPVGSGPYKFEEWVSDQYVSMVAFDDYILGRPSNGRVIVRFIKEAATRTSELLTGTIDAMGDISTDVLPVIEASDNINLIRNPGRNISYLAFADYETNALFSDIRLRQAVAYALDIDAINYGLFGENMITPGSMIPPTMQGGDREFTIIGYDPDKAVELMTEAGYPDGFKFTMLAYTVIRGYNPVGERLAVQIMSELDKIGIKVDIIIKPWADFLNAMYMETPDYDAILGGWGAATNDTSYMLQLLEGSNGGTGSNHSGYNNPEFDALIAAAKAATDYDTAADLFAQAAQLANEDVPVVLLGHGVELGAISKKIINGTEWYGRWGFQEDHFQKVN